MFGCVFAFCISIPVDQILHGRFVAKEYAVKMMGVQNMLMFAGNLASEGEEFIKGWYGHVSLGTNQ